MANIKRILDKNFPQIAAEQNFANYDLVIDPIDSGGANFTSKLYNITVKEGINTHNMFAKVAALGEKMRLECPRLYNTEIFVYTKLAKLYEDLENEHDVPQEHRLVLSKFYGCDPTEYEETIILEDLVKKGYQPCDRFKIISWEYAAAAMSELAKIHGLSFAYSEYYPYEFNKVLKDLKFVWNYEYGNLVEYFDIECARAVDSVHEKTRDKLLKYFKKPAAEKFSNFFKDFSRRPVLLHGDFRPSNLLHRIRDDGKIDIKVVDFQNMQGSSPVVDVLYFLITASDATFRAQYYERLLDHYYTELQGAIRRFHLDPEKIYSRADFDYEWKEKLPIGLTIAVFALPIVTVCEEDAAEVNKDLALTSLSAKKTSDRYVELMNEIVNDFIKWGILQ